MDRRNEEADSRLLLRSDHVERRLYQENIAARACLRNTLVVLPTALGKTVITALVAAHFLYNYKQTRILLMAPTRPLVLQHRESFLKILKMPEDQAIALTGKTSNVEREVIWKGNCKIIFATPQVVRNDLMRSYVDVKQFSLMVFDECHRATKDYAYTYVAKKYMERSPWPIILGTTASPGADKDRIDEVCRALFIEQIEYRSEEDVDVIPYVNPVQVEWRYVDLPQEYRILSQDVRKLLDERLSWLRRMGYLQKTVDHATRRDLLDIGQLLRNKIEQASASEKGPIYAAIVTQSSALTLFHALELLETQGIETLAAFLEKIESADTSKRSYRTITNNPQYEDFKQNLKRFRKVLHPKAELLIEEIQGQLRRNPSSRVIVFTQYRDTATILVERLRQKLGIGVERFVGQTMKEGDAGLTQDQQSRMLRDFESGGTRILVATCVAEEGLDIPSVDLVIFYEPVPSEIRHIQRRGRTGRKAAGRAVILAAKNTFDIAYLYASKRRVEKMRKITRLLNQNLKPLIRLGPSPEPLRLSSEELQYLERRAGSTTENKPKTVEEDEGKKFLAEVERASRRVMTDTMKAGGRGIVIEEMMRKLTQEDISPNAAAAAVNKLEDSGHVIRLGSERIASVTAAAALKESESDNGTKDLFRVVIEKVYPGKAVAWINDRWRARILPEDFEGPSNLLKKDTRFIARGTLYREDGVLCFRVNEIVELAS